MIFSTDNLLAAKNGLKLWSTNVVPSLLPFFIATELLNYTNITIILGKLLSKVMRPMFNIPGEGAYAFIMGIISGYPVGAKIVSDLYEKGTCTKNEAERMLAFTNNSGPLFIIGTVGILLFGNTNIGALLFFTHIISGITVGILLGICSRMSASKNINQVYANKSIGYENKEISFSDLGNILALSISKSISTVLQIGGFVVLFSVILSIVNRLNIIEYISNILELVHIPNNISKSLFFGIIELTNGVGLAANLHEKIISNNIILCSFLLGFGGLSVLLQVLSIISKVGLNIKTYFIGKLLHGIFAALYTYIFIYNFSIFNLDICTSSESSFNVFSFACLFSLAVVITCILFHTQKKFLKHN